jgi:hypothetical protein
MDFVNITLVISGSVFHHWVKKKFIGESRGTILQCKKKFLLVRNINNAQQNLIDQSLDLWVHH